MTIRILAVGDVCGKPGLDFLRRTLRGAKRYIAWYHAATAKADELTKQRTSVMNGSFLRASLFTSVLSYGVCLFAIGVGLTLIILGWALNKVSSQTVPVVAGNGATRA